MSMPDKKLPHGNMKYPTPKDFRDKMEEYFDDPSNRPFLMQDLALHMGITTERLYKYGKMEGYTVYLNRARQRVEVGIAKRALVGKYNSYFAQFVLKNMGWKDQMDINATAEVGVTFTDDIPRIRKG